MAVSVYVWRRIRVGTKSSAALANSCETIIASIQPLSSRDRGPAPAGQLPECRCECVGSTLAPFTLNPQCLPRAERRYSSSTEIQAGVLSGETSSCGRHVHSYLLFLAWLFSTGAFGPLVPESWILRFMAPECTSVTSWAYDSPYHATPLSAKASIQRFAHMVPGIPDFVLGRRGTRIWRLLEGFLGPSNFTDVTAQAMLAERNERVRAWWSAESSHSDEVLLHLDESTVVRGASSTNSSGPSLGGETLQPTPDVVMVLFGADDPLLSRVQGNSSTHHHSRHMCESEPRYSD
ncbi:hypothetical protein ANO11243_018370 [Dothideomycetidae sp. 11243]|nr:hypothetical protein ANO11243_018370 [fungal sp. No.11243]